MSADDGSNRRLSNALAELAAIDRMGADTYYEQERDRQRKQIETVEVDEHDRPTSPQPIDPLTWAVLFPNYPDDATCIDCGGRFDEHYWGDDCFFSLNDEAGRLARARREVRLLLERGMTLEQILEAVEQTAVAVNVGF